MTIDNTTPHENASYLGLSTVVLEDSQSQLGKNNEVDQFGQHHDVGFDNENGEFDDEISPTIDISDDTMTFPSKDQTDIDPQLAEEKKLWYYALASLCIAVLSWSVMGPSFVYLNRMGVKPIMAAAWRNVFIVLFVAVPASIEIYTSVTKQHIYDWIHTNSADIPKDYQAVSPSDETCEINQHNEASLPPGNLADIELQAMTRHDVNENEPQSPTAEESSTPNAPATIAGWDRPVYNIFLASFFWATSLSLWVTALRYTSTVIASLLAAISPLMFVFYYKVKNIPVSQQETISVLVAFSGVVLCLLSGIIVPGDSRNSDDNELAVDGPFAMMFGGFLCALSSVATCFQCVYASKARQHIPVFTYTMIGTFLVCFLCLFFSLIFENARIFCLDTDCFFGFATERMILQMLVLGFIGGWVGLVGFNFAVKYVSSVIYTVGHLMDPALTGFVSYFLGYENLPTWPVYLGGTIIIVSIIFLVLGETKRKEQERLDSMPYANQDDMVLQEDIKAIKIIHDMPEALTIDGNTLGSSYPQVVAHIHEDD